MLNLFFKTLASKWFYLVFITGFAFLQALPISFYTKIPLNFVFIDSLFYSIIYGVLAILMWNTLKYAKFESLPFIQELLIYIALLLLSLLVIFGAGYVFYEYILPRFNSILFGFLPIRMLLSLLVLGVFIQHFKYKLFVITNDNMSVNEQDIISPIAEEKQVPAEMLERIAVKSNQKIHVILVSDIIFLQADGDYVQIFTLTGKYLKEQTMKYFEENLPSTLFVRVHRSCIVNVQNIVRIELYDKQSQQLTLKNGHQIKVSQAGYKSLRKTLNL